MSKLPDLPAYAFTVHRMTTLGEELAGSLRASYFQEQGSLILFKDENHTVVEAFRLDSVVRIVRTDAPVE